MRRVCFVTIVLCLAVPIALAQDFAKVAPNNVKVEIDNPDVRVLRVHYGSHDKTAMHWHLDHVIVFLTDNHTRHTFPDGTTKEFQSFSMAYNRVKAPKSEHLVSRQGFNSGNHFF